MIDTKDKSKCSGCAACVYSCPKGCIIMQSDLDGFLYPKIIKEQCIYCGLCDRACPIQNSFIEHKEAPTAYAVVNKNTLVRRQSTSGGAFSVLATAVLEAGGAVFGAIFMNDFSVAHYCIEKVEDLWRLRGSKYVQSRMGDSYIKVQQFLKNGRRVLFSGTPCQIAGLKKFLQIDYENLLLVDIICHGVPSPLLWEKYVKYQEKVYHSKIEHIEFRAKTQGWKKPSMKISFINGKVYEVAQRSDVWNLCFLRDIGLRPSCYNCSFRGGKRDGDITIADFWGIENICPELDDGEGTSLLLLNTQKGKMFFSSIIQNFHCKEVDWEKAVSSNIPYITSPEKNEKYESFMRDSRSRDIKYIERKYCRDSFIIKIKKLLYKIKKKVLRSK